MAEYRPGTATLGNLIGICPCCESMMFRRVNVAKLEQICGKLDIALPQAPLHIGESTELSVNSDFRHQARTHDSAQPQ
jgi:hypothetical protein